MKYSIEKVSEQKKLIEQLFCTELGQQKLDINVHCCDSRKLSLREKNFVRLLQNPDEISRQTCLSMVEKICLPTLIEMGILYQKTSNDTEVIESNKDGLDVREMMGMQQLIESNNPTSHQQSQNQNKNQETSVVNNLCPSIQVSAGVYPA